MRSARRLSSSAAFAFSSASSPASRDSRSVSPASLSCAAAAAGVGLLQYQSWGRAVALVVATILLFKVPLGTALGIYAYWVLLSERGRQHFQQHAVSA